MVRCPLCGRKNGIKVRGEFAACPHCPACFSVKIANKDDEEEQ